MKLRETAKDYNELFGFNVIPLENKVPKLKWEQWQFEEMSTEDIDSLGWNFNANGIGAISGIKKLRCLDFDKVSKFSIIQEFVRELGLPLKYEWIVKSGSGNGYHIWFYCSPLSVSPKGREENLNEKDLLIKTLGGDKSYYKFDLKEAGICDHIELRWKNCQTVLPPSLHPSGNKYLFVHGDNQGLPNNPPMNVGVGKLIEVLREYCKLESETKDEKREILRQAQDRLKDARREMLEARGKSQRNQTKYLKEAAEFVKGKINNYDEFMRIGFALASIGEDGRELFLDITKDNPDYPADSEFVLNKKFDGFLKDYRGDITLGTFFEIAKKYGYEFPRMRFWSIDKGKATIIRNSFIEFLESEGYGKMILGKGYLLIREQNNIVSDVTSVNIKDFVIDYVNDIAEAGIKRIVKEALIRSAKTLFGDAVLECLQTLNPVFAEDTKNKSLFFFRNCFIEVNDKNINPKRYDELKGNIWERQLIQRDFELNDSVPDFEKFIGNVCRGDANRINALRSAIGYLLQSYKDPTKTKAIIFIDEKLSENAFGRSGKGVVASAIKELKRLITIDGKNFKFDKSFPFQSIEQDTQVVFFDDVDKKFGFDRLFSIITEGITVEKKNRNEYSIPFEKSPKILITTNHSISGSDDSSIARQFVIEFSDYYNAKHQPINDFNKMFYIEWDKNEWNAFYTFMLKCCQLYLANGFTSYNYINLTRKKLIDETNQEFEEFISEFVVGTEYNKKDLYERFKKEYEDYGQIKQNTFSKWTKVYAELNELEVQERKSGGNRYFTLVKKGEKVVESGRLEF